MGAYLPGTKLAATDCTETGISPDSTPLIKYRTAIQFSTEFQTLRKYSRYETVNKATKQHRINFNFNAI